MYQIQQNTAAISLVFLMIDSVTHINGKAGIAPTVTLSKNGAAFAAAAGAVSGLGNGWYKVAANSTDSNTLGSLILHATGTGADPTDVVFQVVAYAPYTLNLGIANIAVNLTQIDGLATNGNNATLNLKKLNIVNNAGDAVVASSTGSNGRGINASGNGTGAALLLTGGATAQGIRIVGGSTSGDGILITTTNGHGFLLAPSGVGKHGFYSVGAAASGANAAGIGILGVGGVASTTGGGTAGVGIWAQGGNSAASTNVAAAGLYIIAGADVGAGGAHGLFIQGRTAGDAINLLPGSSGNGITIVGGSSSGHGISISTTSGHGITITAAGATKHGLSITTTDGHGITVAASGSSRHGITVTGGTAGVSDGLKATAGTGGVDIRGNITGNVIGDLTGNITGTLTGNITGNLSGSVGSVTGAVGSVTGAVGSVTGAVGSVTSPITLTNVQGIKKNTAFSNFMFKMFNLSGTPTAGYTVTGTVSIDGAGYIGLTNSVSGVSDGTYKINLAAADLNGDMIALRFTAGSARDTDITIHPVQV